MMKTERILPDFFKNEEPLVVPVLPEILTKTGYCKAGVSQAVAVTLK